MKDLISKPKAKKFNLLVLLLFFCCQTIVAQTDSMTLVPHWSKGDSKRYEIVHSSSVSTSGVMRSAAKKTQLVTLRVAGVRDSLTDMIWKFGDSNYSDSVSTASPLLVLFQTMDKGIEVKYTIHANGSIKSISNYDEILSMIKLKTDSIVLLMSKEANVPQAKTDAVKFQLSTMFGTIEALNAGLLNDIYQYHQLYGYTYRTKSITSIPDTIFSPTSIGNQNTLEINLASIDPIKRRYHLHATLVNPSMSRMHMVRKIDRFYSFESPNNWIIEYRSTNSIGPESPKLEYNLRMIK